MLLVDQRFQHVIDHREMVFLTGKLLLEIDQIGRYALQAPGEKLGEMVSDLLVRLQEFIAVTHFVCAAPRQSANGGHMGNVQQYRYLAEDSARIGHDIDL